MAALDEDAPFTLAGAVSAGEAGPGAPATEEDWLRAAAAVLRRSGRLTAPAPDTDVLGALTRKTLEGIAVPPLGTASAAAGLSGAPVPAATGAGWDIRALVTDADPVAAGASAVADLENGATSLWLEVGDHALAVGDLASALDGVYLDMAPVVLQPVGAVGDLAVARSFADVLRTRGVAPAPGTNLGADPLARVGRGADLTGRRSGRPGDRRRRHGGTCCRRRRRGRTGLHTGRRRRIPPAAHPRRHERAGCVAAHRIPVRGHRRTVRHDRQVPCGPEALASGGRTVRCGGRRSCPVPARRHLRADDDQVRPLGESDANHRRRLRRRHRRSGRGDRAAVRRRARRARGPGPAAGQEHLLTADFGGACRRGRRSGGWRVRGGTVDRADRGRGLGGVRPHRARRRYLAGGGRRFAARSLGVDRPRTPGPDRAPPNSDHRRQRIPAPVSYTHLTLP